ncbi:Ribosomal protein L15, conserved site-containing protein [Artemisia annua]|uniref:Ribosomal protein L15, conserved site-containing protein n=2 Tax=Artemisia annua TaxID=35608 RepID=A0A2U1NIV2_ARTAN|nr:Ribosomal protein L15, conserved site-containing protein [Artemisia annua]
MVKPAEENVDKLKRNGNAIEFSYAMMLCMYKKIGSFEEAFEIAKNMRELGLLTDLLRYNHVLGFYASDGRFKEAVTIFKELIESGVQPDDSTFKSLGVVLMKRGVPKKVVTRLEVMWRNDYDSGLEAWLATLSSIVGRTGNKRGHISAGHGRNGKHRKHPGCRCNAGGMHHHRILFDKYHLCYFGKVGIRYFHMLRNKFHCPIVNADKLWSMVPQDAKEKSYADKVLVVVVTQFGCFKVLGKGVVPLTHPMVVKAKLISKTAEKKIKENGGAVVLTA